MLTLFNNKKKPFIELKKKKEEKIKNKTEKQFYKPNIVSNDDMNNFQRTRNEEN